MSGRLGGEKIASGWLADVGLGIGNWYSCPWVDGLGKSL